MKCYSGALNFHSTTILQMESKYIAVAAQKDIILISTDGSQINTENVRFNCPEHPDAVAIEIDDLPHIKNHIGYNLFSFIDTFMNVSMFTFYYFAYSLKYSFINLTCFFNLFNF